MKHALSLLLPAILFTIIGCSSDSPTANSTPNGSVSAKVDGGNWSATTVSASSPAGNLVIVGTQISGATTRQISITVVGAKTGEFQLGGISGAVGTLVSYTEGSGTSVKTYTANDGRVTISELTTTGAKGSFTTNIQHNQAGQSDGTKHAITEGSFDVKF
jgi:hypothetical protein